MQERRFYIYEHRVKEEFEIDGKLYPVGTVVYVGSGATKRFRSVSGRSQKHLSVWDKIDKVIVLDRLTHNDMKEKETEYISKYIDTGYLFNKRSKYYDVHEISLERLNELFYLSTDSESGLRWRINKHPGKKDNDAGCKNSKGYWKVSVDKKQIACHRIIWIIHNNMLIPNRMVINHKNLNPSDNSIDNLECVDIATNNKRRGVFKNTPNGVKGLAWKNKSLSWRATVYFDSTEKSKSFAVKPLMFLGFSFEEAKEIKKIEAIEYLEQQKKSYGY